MKKLILLLESILLYVSFAISQNAIAVCGREYQLKSGNYDNYNIYASNPRWVAVSMPDDAHPPYYTGTSDGLYVRVNDYGVYTFVLRENVNGVSFTVETVTVEFLNTPSPYAGNDFEVWGLDFQLHAISSHIEGDNITGMWTCISNGTATFEDSTDPQTMVHYSDYGYATFRWAETAYPHIEVANDITCSAFDDVTVTIMGYGITATSSNPNHGTVTGGGVYDYGTEIQIFAIPTEHYHFVQWNDGNTDNPRTITVTGDATYTAEFAIDQHTIIVETADVEIGVVSEGGTYDYGTEIQIDATPSEGYRFVSWNDGNTENPRTIIVTENSTYIAVFADIVCENPCPIVTNQVMTYTNIPYYVPEGLVYYTNENIDICITIKCPEMTDCVFFSMPATVYIDSLTITSLSNLPNGLSYCVSRVDLNQTTNVYATIHITGTAPSTSGEYELELSGKITGTAGVDGLGYELTDQAVTVATGIVLNIIRPSYIITATAGENGTISPAEATVEEGENASFTIAANEGYRIASVIVDAETENEANVTAQLVEGVYTFENVTANHTIAATFDALPVSDIQVKLYADANGTAEIGTTITLSATDDFTVYPAIFNAGPDGASGIVTFDLQISGASVYGGPQSISLGGYPVPVNYFIITDTRTFTADYMDRLGLTGTFALCFTVAYSGSGYDSDLSNNSLCILVTRTNGEAPTAIISDLEVKVFRDQQMTSEIESNLIVAADEDVVVYPVIFNAGPDVAVGTVNLNVQLDGVSIGEGEITLASQPIAANHSVTITPLIISAALLDQGGITGNFELCFSITYSGNDPDLSNNSLCISVTRTTQLEVDFTTVPAAINGVVTIGVGDVVTFTNRSVYAHHVAWTFEGGSPATSTENYVTVTYATAGIYTATLTAYNEDETLIDSKTTTIIVGSAPIYTITATAGENGTITPNGEVMVYEGYDQTFTIAPNEGYRILSVTVDDVDTTTSVIEGVFSFVNVAENHTIAATFEQKPTYTIMVQSSNEEYGTVDGGGTFYEGDEIYITASANHGYRFVQWNDGNTQRRRPITVTENATYIANFVERTSDGLLNDPFFVCTFEETTPLYTTGRTIDRDTDWELQTLSESDGDTYYFNLNYIVGEDTVRNSETPEHWMMIDGGGIVVDGVGTGYNFDSYMLFTGIDLSDAQNPQLSFREYRRLYNIPVTTEATVVEVSTDGGTYWTKHVIKCESHDERGFSLIRIPIFEAAGYDNVMIRFVAKRQEDDIYNYFVGNPLYSDGSFIVVWEVDDILINDAQPFDLAITDVRMNKGRCDYYSNRTDFPDYTSNNYHNSPMFGQTPLTEWQSDDMFASFNVAVENRGYQPVAPTVNITVTSPSGDVVWTDSFVSPTEISAYERDTIDVLGIIGGEYEHIFKFNELQRQNIETGEYIVNYSVSTTITEDPTPDNNETSHPFYITEEAYSPATPNITTTRGPNNWSNFVDGDEIMAEYTYYTLPSQEIPVFVYISEITTPGAQIIANIYEYDADIFDYQITKSSSLYTITSNDLGRWINVPLQSPLMLTSFDDVTSPQSKTLRVGIAFYPNGGTLSLGASNDMNNKGWVCKYNMANYGYVTSINVTAESVAPAISLGDPRDKYTITVLSANESYGTVDGGGTFYEDDVISIEANPYEGYRFVSWNDGNTDNPRIIAIEGDSTFTATFTIDQHTITVVSADLEMGTVSEDGTYDYGTEIQISATANEHYHFVQWNDGDTDNPRTITVTEDATYTASFAINQHTITVESNSEAMGTVSESGTYDYGTEIQISATASEHYHFVQWNDGNDDNPRTITVTEDATYTAEFAIDHFTVTVLANNDEMGIVSGGGTYDYGTEIQISATASEHYLFVQWNDGNDDNPRTVIVTEDITYTATFGAWRTVTVASTNETEGTVEGTGEYVEGTTIQITAIPNEHYHFVHWIDEENPTRDFNTDNPRTITVTGNMTYTAVFAIDQHTITVESADEAMGTVSESNTYDYGAEIQISATAAEHYHFVQWSDGNTDNPRTITVTGDATYIATFAPNNYTIVVSSLNEDWGTVSEGGTFPYGTEIQISATPRENYAFVAWTDGNTDNPRTITVVADAEYTATFTWSVGIDETAVSEIALFPNPATDILNITSSETISEIEIVNVMGQVVKRIEVNADNAVCDVEDLKAGVYVVRIHAASATLSQRRFVKE